MIDSQLIYSPNVTKYTLCGFLKQCIGFLAGETEQIEELRHEVGGLQKEVWTSEEEAGIFKDCTINAQQSFVKLSAYKQNFYYVRSKSSSLFKLPFQLNPK